jgi:septal ring factor EnvC (AmiA/AmiB activator)
MHAIYRSKDKQASTSIRPLRELQPVADIVTLTLTPTHRYNMLEEDYRQLSELHNEIKTKARAKIRTMEQDQAEVRSGFQSDLEDLAFKKVEVKRLTAELTAAQVSISGMSTRLESITMQAHSKVSTLKGEADASEVQVETLQDQVKELTTNLKAAKKRNRAGKEALLKAQGALDAANAKAATIVGEYETEKIELQADITNRTAELTAAKTTLAARDRNIATSTATAAALDTELDTFRKDLAYTQRRLADTEELIAGKEAAKAKADAAAAAAAIATDAACEDLHKATAMMTACRFQMESVSSQLQSSTATISNVTQAITVDEAGNVTGSVGDGGGADGAGGSVSAKATGIDVGSDKQGEGDNDDDDEEDEDEDDEDDDEEVTGFNTTTNISTATTAAPAHALNVSGPDAFKATLDATQRLAAELTMAVSALEPRGTGVVAVLTRHARCSP